MYMKVFYNLKNGREDASVEDVRAALPADMSGLTVDDDLGYPCVEFPKSAKYDPDFLRVQRALPGRWI